MSYQLGWLLDRLEHEGVLDAGVRTDVEVRAPRQRARLMRQGMEALGKGGGQQGGARLHYVVSPAELVASFGLTDPSGAEIDEPYLARFIASEASLPFQRIDPLELDMALITRTVSKPFALRHVVLPLVRDESELTVALDDPFDPELVENLARIARGPVRTVVSAKQEIIKALTEVFGFRRSVEFADREAKADALGDFEQLVELRSVGEIEASDTHIVNAVDFMFRYAFDQRASDIHIEPRRGDSQVRLRIDGVLHDVHVIPRRVHPAIVSRIKTMARMDIAERRRPQDGRIKTSVMDKEVELRVSTMPVAFGEKAVVRIFDPDSVLQEIADLGFEPDDLAMFQRWIGHPHGLILITGPTGSGKTTTLYTTLATLADETVNVTSVEDPIEMITDRFNQVAVKPRIGVDFPSAMRTILRQDPDIIMVGEIRDAATAEMAVQAALTGHLVFSTLHTNDTVSAVTRLLDLGVPSFLIGSTLVGVMAQRLMRRICAACSEPHPLSAQERSSVGIAAAEAPRYSSASNGVGCPRCRGTGYFGRIGVFEMLDFITALRTRVLEGCDAVSLLTAAQEQGFVPLREGALRRFAQGVTSLEEVVRVTGLSAAPAGS